MSTAAEQPENYEPPRIESVRPIEAALTFGPKRDDPQHHDGFS